MGNTIIPKFDFNIDAPENISDDTMLPRIMTDYGDITQSELGLLAKESTEVIPLFEDTPKEYREAVEAGFIPVKTETGTEWLETLPAKARREKINPIPGMLLGTAVYFLLGL